MPIVMSVEPKLLFNDSWLVVFLGGAFVVSTDDAAIFAVSFALFTYSVTALIGASGLLAVNVAALR